MQQQQQQQQQRSMAQNVDDIFDQNRLADLTAILSKRHCLNRCNMGLNYGFHLVQAAGILTTTVAAGYNDRFLIWVGVGMNLLASLINVYEKTNSEMMKRLLKDLVAIKNNTYLDEGEIVPPHKTAADQHDPTVKTIRDFRPTNNTLETIFPKQGRRAHGHAVEYGLPATTDETLSASV